MWNWIEKAYELRQRERPFVLVTLIESIGSSPRKVGARMIVLSESECHGTVGGGQGEKLAIEQAMICLREQRASELVDFDLTEKTGQVCGGRVRFLLECWQQSPNVYLFGAGHVGQALAQVLEQTPLRMAVSDARARWLEDPGLGSHVRRMTGDPVELARGIRWGAEDSVVIMTHDHALDYELVRTILPCQPGFLGLIGSRGKRANFEKRLLDEGIEPQLIARVLTCPVGLVRAGDSPREIAISLAAQLLAVHYGEGRDNP